MKKKYSRKTHFKSETWLNTEDSPSTGSLVCYDGDIEYSDDGEQPCTFIEISDCQNKIRLHQAHTDSTTEFIRKIDLLIIHLTKFRNFLEFESPHRHDAI